MFGLNNWKAKALKLKTIVLVGHELAKELSPATRRTFDLMREFRRLRKIGEAAFTPADRDLFDTLSAEMEALPKETPTITFEPEKLNGWLVHAGMYLIDGKHWWIARAARNARTFSPRDRAVLEQTLDLLGGHIEHSALSSLTLEELVEEGVPFLWTWINQDPLLELHIANKGKKTRARDFKVVAKDVAPASGFERMPPLDSDK